MITAVSILLAVALVLAAYLYYKLRHTQEINEHLAERSVELFKEVKYYMNENEQLELENERITARLKNKKQNG